MIKRPAIFGASASPRASRSLAVPTPRRRCHRAPSWAVCASRGALGLSKGGQSPDESLSSGSVRWSKGGEFEPEPLDSRAHLPGIVVFGASAGGRSSKSRPQGPPRSRSRGSSHISRSLEASQGTECRIRSSKGLPETPSPALSQTAGGRGICRATPALARAADVGPTIKGAPKPHWLRTGWRALAKKHARRLHA